MRELVWRERKHPFSTISIKLRIYIPAKEYMEKNTEFEYMSEYVCFLLEREMGIEKESV